MKISELLAEVEAENVLNFEYTLAEYNKQEIKWYFDQLTPENAHIYLIS
jgi:Middle or third domain of peptidase_M16